MWYTLSKEGKAMAIEIYRLLEWLDGERDKRIKIIPYPIAQRIKVFLLNYFI
jgi:hypothetical protein